MTRHIHGPDDEWCEECFGEVSQSNVGPSDESPYVPSWCYKGPRPHICTTCECGENYHNDAGECLRRTVCGCTGYTGIARE